MGDGYPDSHPLGGGTPKPMGVCEWRQVEEYDYYDTSCGQSFTIIEGTPKENLMHYCCYCGKPLKYVPWQEEDDG